MNYKDMYLTLFCKISDVIEELQQVQRETEKMYAEATDTEGEE